MTRPQRPLALVTGATRGIGRAIAHRLGTDHDLILTARTQAALDTAATQLPSVVATHAADLAEPAAVASLAEDLANASRPVQVLILNAGVAPSAPLHETTDAMWAQTFAVNVDASFALCRALLPIMSKAGFGRVVFVASTAALKGYAYTAAYSASKAAVVGLMRALAAEFARAPVTVNAVCPGFTDTDIAAEAVANIGRATGRDETQARRALEKFSPQGRLLDPGEVAAAVAYLVSDSAGGVHGQTIAIDGGETG